MPTAVDGDTTATFEVSGCAPPTPSIWVGSGDPMTRSSRSSRSAGSAGRSEARKYSPFDVPPRICMARIPSMPLAALARPVGVFGVGDVLDPRQLGAEVVEVEAEHTGGQVPAVRV